MGTQAGKFFFVVVFPLLAAVAPLRAQSMGSPAVGTTPGLALASEAGAGDYIVGSLKLSTSFSDNVLLSDIHPVSDVSFAVQPGFSLAKTLGWLHMTWDVSPGLVKYQTVDQRDRLTGAVVTNIDAKPKEHWTVRLRNNYQIRTNPPFDTFNTPLTTTFFEGAGGGTILPLVNQTAEEGNLDIGYQPGPSTTLQATGFFRDYMYHPIPGVHITEGLVNSVSTGGRLQLIHQVSPRFFVGASYTLQDIRFSFTNHAASVLTHDITGVFTFAISPTMQLQVFAGPELSHIHNQILLTFGLAGVFIPVVDDTTTASGGVIYSLHKDRTTMQLSAIREMSGGTGLTAAAQSNKATLTFRRELASRWYGELSADYALFTPVGPGTNGFDVRALSARAGLNHKITQNLSFEIQASRGQQTQTSQIVRRNVNVDFGMISLKYQIKRPL